MTQSNDAHISNTLVTEMMIAFAQSGDLIQALEVGLPKALTAIHAQAGSLFLYLPDSQQLECAVCIGPVDIKGLRVPSQQGIVGEVFHSKRSQLIANVARHQAHYRAVDEKTGFHSRSIITVPIYFGAEVYGALQAINRLDVNGTVRAFSAHHLAIFESIALTLGLALKNIKLTEKIVSDKLLQKDMAEAQLVQQCLLPSPDQFAVISGGVIPFRALSGDFIDYLAVDEKIAFIEGDVSGKGLPAALLMARSIALFRAFARRHLSAADMAQGMNAEICAHGSADRFVTVVLGWYHPSTHTVEWVNCGHNPVLHHTPATAHWVGASAPPLGVTTEQFAPQAVTLPLSTGHSLYIATDGITEARLQGQELGLKGLEKLAAKQQHMTAQQRSAQILAGVEAKRLVTHDDATLLVLSV